MEKKFINPFSFTSFLMPPPLSFNPIQELIRDSTALGGTLFYAVLLVLTLALGQYTLAKALLIGFLLTAAVVILIRWLYFKPRPVFQRYDNLLERLDASAFPSWHAARAVFLALLFSHFFENLGVAVLLLFSAGAVCISRILLKKHDEWDIVGGIALGIIAYGITILVG